MVAIWYPIPMHLSSAICEYPWDWRRSYSGCIFISRERILQYATKMLVGSAFWHTRGYLKINNHMYLSVRVFNNHDSMCVPNSFYFASWCLCLLELRRWHYWDFFCLLFLPYLFFHYWHAFQFHRSFLHPLTPIAVPSCFDRQTNYIHTSWNRFRTLILTHYARSLINYWSYDFKEASLFAKFGYAHASNLNQQQKKHVNCPEALYFAWKRTKQMLENLTFFLYL